MPLGRRANFQFCGSINFLGCAVICTNAPKLFHRPYMGVVFIEIIRQIGRRGIIAIMSYAIAIMSYAMIPPLDTHHLGCNSVWQCCWCNGCLMGQACCKTPFSMFKFKKNSLIISPPLTRYIATFAIKALYINGLGCSEFKIQVATFLP